MKVVDVEMQPAARRVTVYFNAEDRVDFRELVRDIAREFHSRIEMRQVGARDTTKLMDGIGPCGRQLCCSSYLRRFEPISVRMAKAQDMPLTDNRLLGNCGRLKCCLLSEFSTYQELRSSLPRVNTPCPASCGGQGVSAGQVTRDAAGAGRSQLRRVPRDLERAWHRERRFHPHDGAAPHEGRPGDPPDALGGGRDLSGQLRRPVLLRVRALLHRERDRRW